MVFWLKEDAKLELDVVCTNFIATNSYYSRGFFHEGTIRRGHKLQGKYFDVLSMSMFVGSSGN